MEVRRLPPQLAVPASSNGRTPAFEAGHRGSSPCAGFFTGSSLVERRAVNPRLRRFDSCPVSRWLAGPQGEGGGLQNRVARFDSGASLSKCGDGAVGQWSGHQTLILGTAGSIPPGAACPVRPPGGPRPFKPTRRVRPPHGVLLYGDRVWRSGTARASEARDRGFDSHRPDS